jgi:hypothetical protein
MISPIRLLFSMTFMLVSLTVGSHELLSKNMGETVYVPSYTEMYTSSGNFIKGFATVTIHNIDPNHSITVLSVAGYDTQGKPVKHYLQQPLVLASFASKYFLIRYDKGFDGSGANFIIRWESSKPVVSPLIESRMLATSGTHGFSISSQGRVVEVKTAN